MIHVNRVLVFLLVSFSFYSCRLSLFVRCMKSRHTAEFCSSSERRERLFFGLLLLAALASGAGILYTPRCDYRLHRGQ